MEGEISNIQPLLQEKWNVFLFALTASFLASMIAWNRGFFKSLRSPLYPQSLPSPIIRGIDLLNGFGFFLLAEIFVVPTIISLFFVLRGENSQYTFPLDPEVKGWVNLLVILGGFIGISVAYFQLKPEQRAALRNQTPLPWIYHMGIGVAAWCLIFPVVLAFHEGVSLILWHIFHHPFVEQGVVQNVRGTMKAPFLFVLTSFAITVLVPLTEEFLFRGLLQSWLKLKFLTPWPAIILSSIVFSLFHFSFEHGMSNIELLSSLFLLSCMLGYLYERQRSLWAPIGLHGFFNLMTLFMISRSD